MAALALAVPTALVGVALTGTTAPAHAAVTDLGGQWLWAGTARTVNNVRDDVGFGLLPKTVQPTGKGVGVALIDTGVAPVPGLTTGNVVNGPDLSFDSQDPAKRYIDGHHLRPHPRPDRPRARRQADLDQGRLLLGGGGRLAGHRRRRLGGRAPQ
jgi:subtilisin family serine protease